MKTILFVEDDPFIVDIYKTKLREAGFNVEAAFSGGECLKKLKEKKPDLLLLDLCLPEIEGWEIIETVKKSESLKTLPIIILSNLSQKQEVDKAINLGAERYLIKAHYTPSEVIKEIKTILND
jgi:CheY-like chemotaxis protein